MKEGKRGFLPVSTPAETPVLLPLRGTKTSAGYDFFATCDLSIRPGETGRFVTDVKAYMEPDEMLLLVVRSSAGIKRHLMAANTVGIIDSDYYYSDNEGHIFSKITNDSNEDKTVEIKAGEGFMQGIFVEYGITLDDDATEVRNGGFGSTTK